MEGFGAGIWLGVSFGIVIGGLTCTIEEDLRSSSQRHIAQSRLTQRCQELGDREFDCVQYTGWYENDGCSCALESGRRIRFNLSEEE